MKNQPSALRVAAVLVGSCATAISMGLQTREARAETIYRCGADLKQYSQRPCDGGQSFEVDDHRNAEQIRQAQGAAETHTRAAHDFKRDREELDGHRPTFGSLSPRAEVSNAHHGQQTKDSKGKGKSGKQTKKRASAQPVDGAEFTAVDQSTQSKKRPAKTGKN